MSGIATRLESYLKENGVDYEVIHHRVDYQAQQAAIQGM